MAIYSASSIQNINNRKVWIWKKFNKQPARYLFANNPYEAKYQFLINKKESTGLKHFHDYKAFIEYSNDMQDVYKNIEEYNIGKKRKILIVMWDWKLNISLAFITESYLKVAKNVRLNSTFLFILKILNKRELQQIALNHSSDIGFKDFIKIYKKCTVEPYSFLVTTLQWDNPLRFRKKYFEVKI